MNTKEGIIKAFGNRLRVRACGVLIENGQVLMVRHKMISKEGVFWSPPGGGVEFGESAEAALKREFLEETGLSVEITGFLCTHEFLAPPLHGIELFFLVSRVSGELITGSDPEIKGPQILEEARFMTFQEINGLPSEQVHHLFSKCKSLQEVTQLSGFYRFIPAPDKQGSAGF